MPTLPEAPEPPAGRAERAGNAIRRAGAAIGADARVPLRLMIFLVTGSISAGFAPEPWSIISFISLLGITLDIARMRRSTVQ